MTRKQFVNKLSERTNLAKEDITLLLEQEEELIYELIAQCDSIQFKWGKISGIEKAPYKVSGKFAVVSGILRNHGWSNWKIGWPELKWSTIAKICEQKTPEEYFNQPSTRYTSLARQYRKDASLPEIPEYELLPEEKIVELCQKAD